MSSALSIAATGLNTANRQVESAARTVVSSGVAGHNASAEPAAPKTAARPADPAAASLPPPRPVFDAPDLATGIADLKQAEIGYKAQLEVLAVASKLEEEAINLIA